MKNTEAQVKKAVEQYLTYQQNMGKLLYLRLQSGSLLVNYGGRVNKINMCGPGTADFVVFMSNYRAENSITKERQCFVTFLEIKSTTGKQKPEQIDFQKKAEAQNCRYFIVRDAGELEGMLK